MHVFSIIMVSAFSGLARLPINFFVSSSAGSADVRCGMRVKIRVERKTFSWSTSLLMMIRRHDIWPVSLAHS